MNENNSFDSLIEKYTSELLSMGTRFNHPRSVPPEKTADTPAEISIETDDTGLPEADDSIPPDEESETAEDNMYVRELFEDEIQIDETAEDAPEPEKEVPDPDAENFALFRAVIFTADGAFPVENAQVTVKKNGELHAFLSTNGSGETKTVKLESYPEENSLNPDSKQQYMRYTADIYADGFEKLSDLPVEAVGGSQILLQENLIPSGGSL